jgi:hypothetical protein
MGGLHRAAHLNLPFAFPLPFFLTAGRIRVEDWRRLRGSHSSNRSSRVFPTLQNSLLDYFDL